MEPEQKFAIRIFAACMVAVGASILFALLKPFTIIGPGQRGVVMKFGKVQDYTFGEGLHFYTPIITSVKKLPIMVLKNDVKATAATKDLQDVTVDVVVNWHFDPATINHTYQTIGDVNFMTDNIITPHGNEVVKAATAQLNAEDIIKKRPELKQDIDTRLSERLSKYGVILDDVSLVNVDFSKEFNAAIEAKQVAEQQAQQAKFIADKAIQDAQAAINQAKGQAEAQRLQQQTLTPELIQKAFIEKWNGVLPVYMAGQLPVSFLNLK